MTLSPHTRRLVATAQVVALLFAMSVVASPAAAQVDASPIDANGVIIMWEDGVIRSASVGRELDRLGLHVRCTLRDGRATVVEADPEEIVALVEELSHLPGVASVEPDHHVQIAWEPNDPYYTSGDQWAYSRIQGPSAWDVERGENSVVVAVIDTGADLTHPDLAGQLDVVNDRNFTVPSTATTYTVAADDHGHGTHVAGIVAAATNNGVGVAGTAPGVRILPLKVMDASGNGDSSAVVAAVDYATSVGVDVINLSLAITGGGQSAVLEAAIQDATAAGVVVVAASGNAGTSGVFYPAAYPECIAVGATGRADARATYSNYGAALDVVAPGGEGNQVDSILSTYWSSGTSTYAYAQGTSMATPFVSGAVALLRSYAPAATGADIRSAIELSAKDLDSAGFDVYTGHGLLQLRNALDYLGDAVAPITTSNAKAVYDAAASIVLSASDGTGVGVEYTWHALDGDSPVTGEVVSTGIMGVHSLAFGSVDWAGNRETTKTVGFTVRGVPDVSRVYGPNRYSTAVALSAATFADGSAPTVVMASGENYPDALSASGLAGVLDAPLLLTAKKYLPPEIAVELRRLGTKRVLMAGGIAAVSQSVENALVSMGITVERIQGPNRYATAAAVAARIAQESSAPLPVAFVVRADLFPDALAVSSLAASQGWPVLLTSSTSLSLEARQAIVGLGISEVVIVGGESAVSAGVANAIAALPGVTVVRRSGVNRYETAASVVGYGITRGWVSTGFMGVATGANFPDALVGGVIAAERSGVLLLTEPGVLSLPTRDIVVANGTNHLPIWVYGGTSAVTDTVKNTLAVLRFQ
ncbi:MAG: S8 family serine peptidase [Coriobacteriia bacterium]|nr:S8 family serine peptidase [Coriobacteriia bacterium]